MSELRHRLFLVKIDCVWFDIDSKVKLNCTWIDTGLRAVYGVGYLLQPYILYLFNTVDAIVV